MKKILLITPDFFDYPKLISECLKKKGYDVDWLSDRPFSSNILKGIGRIFPYIFKKKMKSYSRRIIERIISCKYDIVLIVLGQFFTRADIKTFKEISPNTTFILYMWDSFANFPLCVEASKEYDIVYTFEKNDAIKYGYKFLPLFYTIKPMCFLEKKYFCTFIGTIKKGKLSYLKEIKSKLDDIAKKRGERCLFYYYLQSKLVFLFYKIFNREFKNAKINDFHYKKISYLESIKIMRESFIVVDCTMAEQTGLTMRSFEALSQGTKLFTNNESIKKYDFYNTNNIYVYNGEINENSSFFTSQFQLSKDFLRKYSLSSWIDQIIGGIEDENC